MERLEATGRLVGLSDPPAVIVLTAFDAGDYVVLGLREGAMGFLLKDSPPAQIVDAVRKVAQGDPMQSPSVTAQLIRQIADASASSFVDRASVARTRLAAPSQHELEVATAIGQGRSNTEIAKEPFTSVAP